MNSWTPDFCNGLKALCLSFLIAGSAANAVTTIDQQSQSPAAPPETAQFGQLVGNWKIRDFGLLPDGTWQEQGGADWNFYWILGGTTIQDDWIAPGMDKPEPEQGRQFGTNIRIYNPEEDRWDLAWAANTGKKVDTFTATADGESLVMRGFFAGAESRITFHDITETHFSWKLEQQNAETGAWREVYRIEAERADQRQ